MSKRELTLLEAHVVDDLAEAWGSFLALPEEHTDDVRNFRDAIHTAQRIVLARPGRRQINEPTKVQARSIQKE